ncbi:MAG: hypothetical protein AAFR61_13765 [Bacteroidota bacterium]
MPETHTYAKVESWKVLPEAQMTYTLELAAGDNFLANGLMVKTEVVKEIP